MTASQISVHRSATAGRMRGPRFGRQEAGELLLVLLAFLVYFGVRGLVVERVEEAEANAARLIALEGSLGIFRELEAQELILGHDWMKRLANSVYLYGHGPVIAVFAVALYLRNRHVYLLTRNAFLLSGAIGLVIFTTFPVSPPRLMPEYGFVDTVLEEYHVRRVLMPAFLTNEYAAVPSLHFGWNLLMSLGLWLAFRNRLALLVAVASSLAMLVAIVVTANHYYLDAVAGAVVAMAGGGLAVWLRSLGHRRIDGLGAAPNSLRWLLGVTAEARDKPAAHVTGVEMESRAKAA